MESFGNGNQKKLDPGDRSIKEYMQGRSQQNLIGDRACQILLLMFTINILLQF